MEIRKEVRRDGNEIYFGDFNSQEIHIKILSWMFCAERIICGALWGLKMDFFSYG